jgi:hypothetical protein
VREREDANRTREAGNRDEVEGVVANTLKLFRRGAVGFIDWLDRMARASQYDRRFVNYPSATNPLCTVSLRIVASHQNNDGIAVVGIALIREYRLGCLRAD